MYEDAYLPYQGTGPIPSERLEISQRTGGNGPYVDYLRDGTILLARSGFEKQKRFVDWILGKRKSPAEE